MISTSNLNQGESLGGTYSGRRRIKTKVFTYSRSKYTTSRITQRTKNPNKIIKLINQLINLNLIAPKTFNITFQWIRITFSP